MPVALCGDGWFGRLGPAGASAPPYPLKVTVLLAMKLLSLVGLSGFWIGQRGRFGSGKPRFWHCGGFRNSGSKLMTFTGWTTMPSWKLPRTTLLVTWVLLAPGPSMRTPMSAKQVLLSWMLLRETTFPDGNGDTAWVMNTLLATRATPLKGPLLRIAFPISRLLGDPNTTMPSP